MNSLSRMLNFRSLKSTVPGMAIDACDQILYEHTLTTAPERGGHDDGHGKVDDVATEQEFLQVLEHGFTLGR